MEMEQGGREGKGRIGGEGRMCGDDGRVWRGKPEQ